MCSSDLGFSRQEIPADVLVSAADQTLQDLGVVALSGIAGFESEKTAVFAGLLEAGTSTGSVLTALAAIPEDKRPAMLATQVGTAAVKYLSGLDPRQRNTDAAALAVTLAEAARKRLTGLAADRLEGQLRDVVVPLIALGTVPERMIYDREIVAVQAGRPVEFRLTNSDNMPHNLAIVKPGTLAAVGELGSRPGEMLTQLNGDLCRSQRMCWRPVRWYSPAKLLPSSLKLRGSRAFIRMSVPIRATGGECTGLCMSYPICERMRQIPRRIWPQRSCNSGTIY